MKKMIFIIVSMVFFILNLQAQQSIRDQLFNEAETLLNKVKMENADILAPNSYKTAIQEYERADTELKEGGNLDNIRNRLVKATVNFKKAIEFAELARLSFGSTISSRNAALAAKADQFAVKSWKDAEEVFSDAMVEMENNDLEDAKKVAGKAETQYRKAELEVIEGNLLDPAKELLNTARELDADDYAPRTYVKSQTAVANAEKSLKENRYDREDARVYAEEAKYEAKHAIYLAKYIKGLEKQDNAFEELILSSEVPLSRIAGKLDLVLYLNNGIMEPTDQILEVLDSLLGKINNYQSVILSQNEKVATLAEQINLMEKRMGKYTEAEEQLRRKIAQKDEQEQKINTVAETITQAEGQVLRDGDNVIIRLYGLNFPSGQSTIKPEFFGLLKKVQNAIASFEDCKVIIEGHTDSRGGDAANQRLSNERADAVMKYIIANMDLASERIEAKGHGETKPVASNETEAGRAKNRRIDVIIIPAWAQQ